jgi:hypothetical protein
MLKVVTLMKRRAGLSVEEFQDHLRNIYCPLAAKGPGLRRYVQSFALPQGYGKGLCSMPSAKCVRSATAYEDYRQSVESRGARADDAFFAARAVVMPVDVHVIKTAFRTTPSRISNWSTSARAALEPFRAYRKCIPPPPHPGHAPLRAELPGAQRI